MTNNVDIDVLNELFHVYSPLDLAKVERNKAAFANDVYNVTDVEGNKFVMRVLKGQEPAAVNLEASVQARLNAAGITTPLYLELGPANYVGEANKRRFTISKHIEGSAPNYVGPALVTDFGATLARIHDCLKGVVIPANNMQWFDPEVAKKDLDSYNGQLKVRLAALIQKGAKLLHLGLPETVIHGDLWTGNVFARDDKIAAVFDFETAQNTVRIIDLARTYTSMMRETSLNSRQIIDLLVKGYDSVANTPLTQTEKDNFSLAIVYVSGVVSAWHAVNGTGEEQNYINIGEAALNETE